jgi:hypothetical protein
VECCSFKGGFGVMIVHFRNNVDLQDDHPCHLRDTHVITEACSSWKGRTK